ncbi:hypothetical protein QBC42DRAFT_321115 [Cladorrhinum samala]|uniref:C2H2-type domain-containing protein n=1 Tax=Cladorrhinum samala TaxID=585594 RepID=A0AAV9HA90_9PEZI|nr:hypothetical protein QBC42DRAFT_321115 [Cladorrhinum samala]
MPSRQPPEWVFFSPQSFRSCFRLPGVTGRLMANGDDTEGCSSARNLSPRHYSCVLCSEISSPGFPMDSEDASHVADIVDIRRHLGRFHLLFSKWRCLGGCNKIFDWQRAHAVHDCDEAMEVGGKAKSKYAVVAYNQLVFACGYKGCTQVFDASRLASALKDVKQRYLNHIKAHYKDPNFTHEDWRFITRFRNLLRHHFPEEAVRGLPEDLVWDLESSHHLLEKLETRKLPVDLDAFLSEIIEAGKQHPEEITVQPCDTPDTTRSEGLSPEVQSHSPSDTDCSEDCVPMPSPPSRDVDVDDGETSTIDGLTTSDRAPTASPTDDLPICHSDRRRAGSVEDGNDELRKPLKRLASEVADDSVSLPEPKRVKACCLRCEECATDCGSLPDLFQELAQTLADVDGAEHFQGNAQTEEVTLRILRNTTEVLRSLTRENREMREQVEKKRRDMHWLTILRRE